MPSSTTSATAAPMPAGFSYTPIGGRYGGASSAYVPETNPALASILGIANSPENVAAVAQQQAAQAVNPANPNPNAGLQLAAWQAGGMPALQAQEAQIIRPTPAALAEASIMGGELQNPQAGQSPLNAKLGMNYGNALSGLTPGQLTAYGNQILTGTPATSQPTWNVPAGAVPATAAPAAATTAPAKAPAANTQGNQLLSLLQNPTILNALLGLLRGAL